MNILKGVSKMAIEPAYKKNNIPVVFSVDDNYAPYLSVCLQSLILHSSKKYNYDIWILDGGLGKDRQTRILKLINNTPNISIRFFDITSFSELGNYTFSISNHASIANYYRLFIPIIFENYTKLLYLDCDLLICRDVSQLYNTNLDGSMLGAIKDACTYFNPEYWVPYCTRTLHLKDAHHYVNSGVLICDVAQMKAKRFTEKCLAKLKEFRPVCWDQCLINAAFENDIKRLDSHWNFQWHWGLTEFTKKDLVYGKYHQEYFDIQNKAYIFHYTSHKKPWNRWNTPAAKQWWEYARQSDFIKEILDKNDLSSYPINRIQKIEKNKKEKVKISIIVPVFNVEKYLAKCLDSLINQTLQDIEIICVNDGSTDGSLEILEKYAQKDKRIIVLEQPNKGQGTARNLGLRFANGQYIQFLDSDDYYDLNCCEILFQIMEKSKANVCCFEPHIVYESCLHRKAEDKAYFSLKHNGLHKVIPDMIAKVDCNCWNKIFRMNFLQQNHLTFPEGVHYEDLVFFWKWFPRANTVYFLKQQLINYVRREDSFTSNIFQKSAEDLKDYITTNYLILDDLKTLEKSNEYFTMFVFISLNRMLWRLKNLPPSELSLRQQLIREMAKLMKPIAPVADSELPEREQVILKQVLSQNYAAFKSLYYIDYKELFPAFKHSNIPVVFASDKKYIAFVSVAIASIISNAQPDTNYDIVILATDLYDFHKRMLLQLAKDKKNISIRFFDMNNYIKKFHINSLMSINHITTAAYYRLLVGQIFKNYNKIIYLDSDIIVLEDIAALYKINLQGKTLGACLDTIISNKLDKVIIKDGFEKYLREVLNIPNTNNYFNSGVLVIDLDKWRQNISETQLFELAIINNRFFHDQNVLNAAFLNQVHFLDIKWNVQYHIKFKTPEYQLYIDQNICQYYDDVTKTPSIVHYTSHAKPWNELGHTYTADWWMYARQSPFYEILLSDIQKKTIFISQSKEEKRTIYNSLAFIKAYWTYLRCRIWSNFTWGEKRQHYLYKKHVFHNEVRRIRKLLK